MSRIDELLRDLAPQGVPFKMLGDIAELIRGNGMPKTDLTGEGVGAIHYGQIYTRYGVWTKSTISFVAPETAIKLTKVDPGDIVITNTSENMEDVGKAAAWLGDEPIVTGGHATVIKHSQDAKYLSYWFQSEAFFLQKKALATGTKVIDVSAKQLAKVRIPVPPVEVQREIVRILDAFAALDTAIVEELKARKQQRLAFARTLPEGPYAAGPGAGARQVVQLGEVATQYIDPVRVQPDNTYTNLGVKWYGEGAFARESKLGSAIRGATLYRVKPQQLIFNRMFVTEGSFAIITPKLADGVVSNEFPAYDLDTSRVLPDWLLLYFKDEYTLKRIEGEVTGTERGSTKSRRRWKQDRFEAFEIDLPSIPDQRDFLRTIGAITALESALNDELVARRIQYKYYRDKLFAFEELTA